MGRPAFKKKKNTQTIIIQKGPVQSHDILNQPTFTKYLWQELYTQKHVQLEAQFKDASCFQYINIWCVKYLTVNFFNQGIFNCKTKF